jgi:hypothetical protein
MTTLDNPLHNVVNPSTREIVTMAFDMPLYMAPGEGLMIWILVFSEVSASPVESRRSQEKLRTFNRSTGYMTECSCRGFSSCMYIRGELGGVRRYQRTRPQACSQ